MIALYEVFCVRGPVRGCLERRAELFEGRRQQVLYRAFYDPGVYGWPELSFGSALLTLRLEFILMLRGLAGGNPSASASVYRAQGRG